VGSEDGFGGEEHGGVWLKAADLIFFSAHIEELELSG
jgi:hypothetical protein